MGEVRFLALNPFDVPEPPSFTVLPKQLRWLEDQLHAAAAENQAKILLLHCYPSDLKEGKDELTRLIAHYGVKLVDMGHTHYNKISHDGKTIYTATRSTGQIEEGPVGFSVTNFDHGVVSWRFLELGTLPAVMITSPADERLMNDEAQLNSSGKSDVVVRTKVRSGTDIAKVEAAYQGMSVVMEPVTGSHVWEGKFAVPEAPGGLSSLRVIVTDAKGKTAEDEIRILFDSDRPARERAERDQDNTVEAWPEYGLLGTQLGPNKNGRKL